MACYTLYSKNLEDKLEVVKNFRTYEEVKNFVKEETTYFPDFKVIKTENLLFDMFEWEDPSTKRVWRVERFED